MERCQVTHRTEYVMESNFFFGANNDIVRIFKHATVCGVYITMFIKYEKRFGEQEAN